MSAERRLRMTAAHVAIWGTSCYRYRMGPRNEQYRWWLLDGDLEIVSDGRVSGASLPAALADLSREIDRLGDRGQHPTNQPYKLIVYKGAAVVAVRPATLGIC